MTTEERDLFRARLVMQVTDADRREGQSEARRKLRVNVYRLGHYLKAVGNVMDRIAAGATPAEAFSKAFTPTQRLHTVARRLNLPLGVERGQWVLLATPEPVV